ncbi:MAG: dependent protein [Pseudonocardiales bacterium]|nr:dependent protein [Pseudonocardiales bacterium]
MTRHDDERRRAELVTALGAVRARIADVCAAVGRDPRELTLVAVTKTFPAVDVAALAAIGVTDIGENKDQEARAKIKELAAPQYAPPAPIRWHLVGRVQTNKANSVVSYAHCVHSLDRPKLVHALADAVGRGRPAPLEVFLQVSMDGDPDRGGVPIDRLAELADLVAARPELVLRGVMTVLPLGVEPDEGYARLAELSQRLRADHPQASAISAGMSGDLEAAVRNGSTHVRVGTALLGRREQVLG